MRCSVCKTKLMSCEKFQKTCADCKPIDFTKLMTNKNKKSKQCTCSFEQICDYHKGVGLSGQPGGK